MILQALASMLESDGYGTRGTNIFIGQLPAEKNGIYLMLLGGTMFNYSPLEETVVDVYVQDISSEQALSRVQSIKHSYHRHLATEREDEYIHTILALSDAEDMGRDLDYGKIYKITLQLTHRSTNLIS